MAITGPHLRLFRYPLGSFRELIEQASKNAADGTNHSHPLDAYHPPTFFAQNPAEAAPAGGNSVRLPRASDILTFHQDYDYERIEANKINYDKQVAWTQERGKQLSQYQLSQDPRTKTEAFKQFLAEAQNEQSRSKHSLIYYFTSWKNQPLLLEGGYLMLKAPPDTTPKDFFINIAARLKLSEVENTLEEFPPTPQPISLPAAVAPASASPSPAPLTLEMEGSPKFIPFKSGVLSSANTAPLPTTQTIAEPPISAVAPAPASPPPAVVESPASVPEEPAAAVAPTPPTSPPLEMEGSAKINPSTRIVLLPWANTAPLPTTQTENIAEPATLNETFQPTILSVHGRWGRSFGTQELRSPPIIGPQRPAGVEIYDQAASRASARTTSKSEETLLTYQVGLDLHPFALSDETAHSFANAVSLLVNGQFGIGKKGDDSVRFQMLQGGVQLNLRDLLQEDFPIDVSGHSYFIEFGQDWLSKKTYLITGFPQFGICGSILLVKGLSIQGCAEERSGEGSPNPMEGVPFTRSSSTPWGITDQQFDFESILSGGLLWNWEKSPEEK